MFPTFEKVHINKINGNAYFLNRNIVYQTLIRGINESLLYPLYLNCACNSFSYDTLRDFQCLTLALRNVIWTMKTFHVKNYNLHIQSIMSPCLSTEETQYWAFNICIVVLNFYSSCWSLLDNKLIFRTTKTCRLKYQAVLSALHKHVV